MFVMYFRVSVSIDFVFLIKCLNIWKFLFFISKSLLESFKKEFFGNLKYVYKCDLNVYDCLRQAIRVFCLVFQIYICKEW